MTKPAFILALDLDGTLIPPGEDRVRTAAVSEFSRRFEGRTDTVLTYVTGRHLELALEGVRAFGLPEPGFLACDVGTILYRRVEGSYRRDWTYAAMVRRCFGDLDASRLRRLIAENHREIALQEEDKQGEFKVSFYTQPNTNPEELIASLDALLQQKGARTNIVFSTDPVDGRGLLDILPSGISKVSPVREIAREFGLPDDRVVYAGDSGNDEAALLGGFRSIVVANALEGLKERLRRVAED